ncbi:tRNA glutamyl-Q(34) synthetase GluQRS [Acidovorax sp. 1608163]|uniref:tRNA glutamyl-Q(34) synthetase GluQRS n=1 Tax=Acidovorax sp. 1608163 TaxID=2478662 RepID=UPI000EF70CC6|nr:tRNA glutamyl-Q(34) synthetase GluQRS [Acidovorax sp. 1608163]AYM96509.1 tRNA glutamyl-Q(34) synthetase GluQRS [Acidovorax sp. 1608163]
MTLAGGTNAANARGYVGRFAPSPTGPLHAGSLVAALASWLDARAAQGQWLVRLEDVDTPRCIPGADQTILHQLERCGLHPDAPPVWQSQRGALYQTALDALCAQGLAYPCACSRKEIEEAHTARGHAKERHAALPYPGTCRTGLHGRPARAWRFHTESFIEKCPPGRAEKAQEAINSIAPNLLIWHDRRLGQQAQNVCQAVGDFVLKRADGLWAYQLAVVVDDAEQGITHIVRGEDLADNTPRQILLQQALGLPTPTYLHTPLVLGANGEKLSKQNGAAALDLSDPLAALRQAAQALGLPALAHPHNISVADALALWAKAWPRIYNGAS